jgi:hypothetical protein
MQTNTHVVDLSSDQLILNGTRRHGYEGRVGGVAAVVAVGDAAVAVAVVDGDDESACASASVSVAGRASASASVTSFVLLVDFDGAHDGSEDQMRFDGSTRRLSRHS